MGKCRQYLVPWESGSESSEMPSFLMFLAPVIAAWRLHTETEKPWNYAELKIGSKHPSANRQSIPSLLSLVSLASLPSWLPGVACAYQVLNFLYLGAQVHS